MSEKEEKPATKKTEPAKSGGSFKVILFFVAMGAMVPFGLPSVLLFCVGMIPTFVILWAEDDPRRTGLAAVGYMNLAGVLPFLVDLWRGGHTMDAAWRMIQDPHVWAVVLAAAGTGQLIMYAVPHMIAGIVVGRQEARLRTLRAGMEQLEKIWGPDIGTRLSIDAVRAQRGVE